MCTQGDQRDLRTEVRGSGDGLSPGEDWNFDEEFGYD